MKAKYEGELKSAREIVSHFDKHAISKKFALYLIENEGKKRILESFGNDDTRFYDGDMCVIGSYFHDLKEIKPQIEIPATPFWFKHSEGDLFSIDVNRGRLWDYILYKNDEHWKGVDRLNDETMLNNGTWEIVDEPKKEMRPWEYEEWREWFFTDRVVIDRINQEDNTDVVRTAYITVLGMTPEDEDQFYYMGEGEWLSKDHFLESFFDRHGNKFEKEV